MLSHPGVKDLLIETAEANDIPYQLEVLAWGSTDAAAIQLARSGVPAGCVSIACRYFHTPSEMVDMDDVENSVKLLLAVLESPIADNDRTKTTKKNTQPKHSHHKQTNTTNKKKKTKQHKIKTSDQQKKTKKKQQKKKK